MDDKAQPVITGMEVDQEPMAQLFIGQVFGDNYVIQDLIGTGGMSYVFKALDKSLKRTVAVKIMRQRLLADEESIERFKHEARTIALIPDKNHVVQIFSIGEFEFKGEGDKWPYYVMEFLPGDDLEDLIRDRQDCGQEFSLEEVYAFSAQVLEGLQAAHDAGVIHRDLKPSNIKITRTDRASWVKILDFGISRIVDEFGLSASGFTQDGQFFGTPHIMSPEQCKSEHDKITRATDIYSFGCVVFYLLTGRYPFELGSEEDGGGLVLVSMHIRDDPPMPSEFRPDLRNGVEDPEKLSEIDSVVLKALAKEPADRWQSASELKAALGRALLGREHVVAQSMIPGKVPSARFADSDSQGSDLGDADCTAVSQEINLEAIDARPPDAVNPDTLGTAPTIRASSRPPARKRSLRTIVSVAAVVLAFLIFGVFGLLAKAACSRSGETRMAADAPESSEVPEAETPKVRPAAKKAPLVKKPVVSKPVAEPPAAKPKAVSLHELETYDQSTWNLLISNKLIRPKASGNKMVNCKRAKPMLEIILKHEPNFPDANFYAAECYRRSGSSHLAKKHYAKFLELAPSHHLAPKAKAYVD